MGPGLAAVQGAVDAISLRGIAPDARRPNSDPDYVRVVCGSLENLATAFAQLDEQGPGFLVQAQDQIPAAAVDLPPMNHFARAQGRPDLSVGQEDEVVTFHPGRRQLFLDDYAISTMNNLTKTLHQPEKKGAVISPERPWERYLLQTRSAPAWDEEKKIFKLWVNAIDREPDFMAGPTYFESADGIRWRRPILRP